MKKILFLILVLIITVNAAVNLVSNYEKFCTQTGRLVKAKSNNIITFINYFDKKKYVFDLMEAKTVPNSTIVKALKIYIFKTKSSKKYDYDFIDFDELKDLKYALENMLNHKGTGEGIDGEEISYRTRSGFTVFLTVRKGVSAPLRDVFIATSDAYEELRNNKDERKLDNIIGLSHLSFERLKDLIEIVEKAMEE